MQWCSIMVALEITGDAVFTLPAVPADTLSKLDGIAPQLSAQIATAFASHNVTLTPSPTVTVSRSGEWRILSGATTYKLRLDDGSFRVFNGEVNAVPPFVRHSTMCSDRPEPTSCWLEIMSLANL